MRFFCLLVVYPVSFTLLSFVDCTLTVYNSFLPVVFLEPQYLDDLECPPEIRKRDDATHTEVVGWLLSQAVSAEYSDHGMYLCCCILLNAC